MNTSAKLTNYDDARADFDWQPPARFNFARDVIDK